MREIPMLFNTEMVRAILAGFKTQTRRIIKGLPLYPPYFEVDEGRGWLEDSENGTFYALETFSKVQPGDVLWVRETWQRLFDHKGWRYEYKADYNDDEPLKLGGMYIAWRPSIHMPREAARLFLRVTNVRCERLQDITEDDAIAEGASGDAYQDEHGNIMDIVRPSDDFAQIWNSTIKKADLPRYGWEANPWVWVIEFERMVSPETL